MNIAEAEEAGGRGPGVGGWLCRERVTPRVRPQQYGGTHHATESVRAFCVSLRENMIFALRSDCDGRQAPSETTERHFAELVKTSSPGNRGPVSGIHWSSGSEPGRRRWQGSSRRARSHLVPNVGHEGASVPCDASPMARSPRDVPHGATREAPEITDHRDRCRRHNFARERSSDRLFAHSFGLVPRPQSGVARSSPPVRRR